MILEAEDDQANFNAASSKKAKKRRVSLKRSDSKSSLEYPADSYAALREVVDSLYAVSND